MLEMDSATRTTITQDVDGTVVIVVARQTNLCNTIGARIVHAWTVHLKHLETIRLNHLAAIRPNHLATVAYPMQWVFVDLHLLSAMTSVMMIITMQDVVGMVATVVAIPESRC